MLIIGTRLQMNKRPKSSVREVRQETFGILALHRHVWNGVKYEVLQVAGQCVHDLDNDTSTYRNKVNNLLEFDDTIIIETR